MENKNETDVNPLIERLIYWNHHDDKDHKELRTIEKELDIEHISVDVEKHNELQYTYYFDIDFNIEENLFVEIENGINNGTRVNHEEWGNESKPDSRMIEVLKDVVFNEGEFEKWCRWKGVSEQRKPQLKSIAKSLFDRHKNELMKANRNQSYDNYVTGGGTLKTNKYYQDFYQSLSDKGVFWSFIYEDVEADVNFI